MSTVVFETPGLIDMRAFTVMGLSAKPASAAPIGYFGTGLKYAMAVLVRLGAEPVVWVGEDRYAFQRKADRFRGAEYEGLRMRCEKRQWLRHRYQDLPFTTQYGRNWKAWMAFRELESNTRDEGGQTHLMNCAAADVPGHENCTRIAVDLPDFVTAYERRGEVFLPAGERSGTGIQVLPIDAAGGSGARTSLYWRGLKVYETPKPCLHTYNFLDPLELTEDRTLAHEFYARYALGHWLVRCEDEALIERVVTAGEDAWEHDIRFPEGIAPSAAFHKVMMRHPKGANATAWGYYARFDQRPRPAREAYDLFGMHPRPWTIDGMTICDAQGVTVLEAPAGYMWRWDDAARAILGRINPPADAPKGASAIPAEEPDALEPYEGPETPISGPPGAESEVWGMDGAGSDDVPF